MPRLLLAFPILVLLLVLVRAEYVSNSGATSHHAVATFGAGCFWGAEATFQNVPGVLYTRVGYTGGNVASPSYEMVCSGTTGHTEAVEVTFDPSVISYEKLLRVFWSGHDPTVRKKAQYMSVVFYHSAAQRREALEQLQWVSMSGKYPRPVVTEILPAGTFYPAEAFHQHFYAKKGLKACPTSGCDTSDPCTISPAGGSALSVSAPQEPVTDTVAATVPTLRVFSVAENGYIRVPKVSHTPDEWRMLLTPEQFAITREQGTEPAYHNEYWDSHADGIYRCADCGNDLFDSQTKYESHTGWPSFWTPIASENIVTFPDYSEGMARTEVRCARCGAHLGHVFNDGPQPTGLRYCMNSAALKLVSRAGAEPGA